MTDLVKYDAACRAIAEAKSVDEIKGIGDVSRAMKAAARIVNNRQAVVDWSEVHIRAERRLGEMITEQKQTVGLNPGGRPPKTPTAKEGVSPALDKVGIDWKLSSRSQAIASIPDEEFEATLADHREAQQAITSTTMETLARKGAVHVSYNSGENEWYTPAEYIEAARQTMGGIDTDPASSELANRTVGATTYFDKISDGLMQKWTSNVWMNHAVCACGVNPLVIDWSHETKTMSCLRKTLFRIDEKNVQGVHEIEACSFSENMHSLLEGIAEHARILSGQASKGEMVFKLLQELLPGDCE